MTTTPPSPVRALVTGATGGIGRACCIALVEHARRAGAPIHLAAAASRPGAKLDALVAELNDAGATATGVAGDLTAAADCQRVVAEAEAFCDGLSVLVSNAGASRAGRLGDLTVEQWENTFALNARATWLLARAARASLARSRGSIVAIASMSGMQPHPGTGAYSAAKAALIMLCRQLAQEWAAEGIRVNAVSPGMIHTPLTDGIYQNAEVKARREDLIPLSRIGRPDDIAEAVAYLASSAASYVTGANLLVDGGVSDHMLAMIPGAPKPAS